MLAYRHVDSPVAQMLSTPYKRFYSFVSADVWVYPRATYAFFKSSNGAAAQQAQFRNLGFSLAAGKGTYACQTSIR
jgi:hypothetical protein